MLYQWNSRLNAEENATGQVRIPASARTPEVFFAHDGQFRADSYWYLNTIYRREQERGYAGLEDLWNPGIFRFKLSPGQPVHLICSTEPVEVSRILHDLHHKDSQRDIQIPELSTNRADANLRILLSAAEAFTIRTPADGNPCCLESSRNIPGRRPAARSALGSVLPGYFLTSGKFDDARKLLLGLASQMRDGLIPAEFPEDAQPPRYNAADISLWFINAVWLLAESSSDDQTIRNLHASVEKIIEAYRRGTWLGISCDADGLLASRSNGVPTTWMDAKIGDWVITPRAGRPVELNALWYNALRIASNLSDRFGNAVRAVELSTLADRVQTSLQSEIHQNESQQCCFDVVEDNASKQLGSTESEIPAGDQSAASDSRRGSTNGCFENRPNRNCSRRWASATSFHRKDSNYHDAITAATSCRCDKAQHQGCAYPWL